MRLSIAAPLGRAIYMFEAKILPSFFSCAEAGTGSSRSSVLSWSVIDGTSTPKFFASSGSKSNLTAARRLFPSITTFLPSSCATMMGSWRKESTRRYGQYKLPYVHSFPKHLNNLSIGCTSAQVIFGKPRILAVKTQFRYFPRISLE